MPVIGFLGGPLHHLFRRGIEYGLAEHDVAAIIEVIREISSEEKGRSKTKRSA